ncbi:type VII secretion protein EccB [Streptomyces zhihengii]|uniref:Type VII secretion protein EccB n=1 Tax=Streptomyces zhihengii TaxID=1818004 RepID=A0ABS2V4Q5_9ACTN|nr:type VII secretion protein EccB [Streptomyces zhihengii]MBM9624497.1 type VII secretion protein EccB [Streptomyces zhihengii]
MQSKRDQVQAHAFLMNRLTAGMLLAEPDAPESPLGRTTRGTVFGLVIAVVIAAGAVVFGLIKPGGHQLSGKELVVNRDTGARYLFVNDELRPVRNYSSALLIGGKGLKTDDVRTASLRGKPVGLPVGIPDAPDSIPDKKDLEAGAWQVCSVIDSKFSTALVAGAPADGRRLGADEGAIVIGPDAATTYLVWQGQRLKMDGDASASLGYGSITPRPVSAAFLQVLAPGPDLSPPPVQDRGAIGPVLGGAQSRLGQVFQVQVPGSAPKYYLLKREGLVPLTDTQAALVLGSPATRLEAYGGLPPQPIRLATVELKENQAPGADGREVATGLPLSPPRATPTPRGQSVCNRVDPRSGTPRVSTELVPVKSLTPFAQVEPGSVQSSCIQMDRIVVRPGRGVLVQALTAGGRPAGGSTYLVSDNGAKYLLTQQAIEAFGYAETKAQTLPSPLLSMLPTGPDLDPVTAMSGVKGPITSACPGDEAGS